MVIYPAHYKILEPALPGLGAPPGECSSDIIPKTQIEFDDFTVFLPQNGFPKCVCVRIIK